MSYGWNGNTSQVLRKEPVSMAEPVHRIPPAGASSAQSMRNIPKSNVQQVKDICLYYVQKCSGKYQNNKAAARYIHQMAEEIILQLAGVAHEIKMNRGEPEQFQTLLEEWNEHFPPSLGALGSPKAIAILIANQSREIQKLKDELDVEKLKRENDVSTILRSMDSQLHSYRSSVMNDRRQQRVLFDQEIHNFEEHVKEMKKNFEEEKKTMNNTYNKEFTKLEMHYEGLLKESQQNLEKTLAQHEKDMTKMKQRKDDKIKFLKDRMKELKNKLSTMKQKYNVLAVILNEDTESTSEEDDQDLDENISVLIETDSDISDTESLLNIDLEKRKVEKEERKKKRAEEREEKIANMKLDLIPKLDQQSTTSNNNNGGLNIDLTAELKQLKEVNFAALANIRKLEAKLNHSEKKKGLLADEIKELRKTMDELIAERAAHLKHLKELENLNETLRRALGSQLEDMDLSLFDRTIDSKALLQKLCHTPHFLDRADRGGLRKVEKRLSAYVTPGHF